MEQFGLVYKTIPLFMCLQKKAPKTITYHFILSKFMLFKANLLSSKIFHFAFDVLYGPKPANCILTVFYIYPYCCLYHRFEINLAKLYDPIRRASSQSLANAIWLFEECPPQTLID